MRKSLLIPSAIAGLLLLTTPISANPGLTCNPLRNFMLTTGGRCINLDYIVNGSVDETTPQPGPGGSQAGFGEWKVPTTAIAYQGSNGMRRVRIALENGGAAAANPFGVEYRITEGGSELYRGSILNTSPFAPGQTLTLETLVGPDSLRGSRIGDLKVEVLDVID